MNDNQIIIRIAITFIFAVLFGTSAFDKLKSKVVPDWFIQQFSKSLLGPFPGFVKFAFWQITILETLLFLGFLSSLVFPSLLLYSLLTSLFLFGALCFGLRITSDFQGSANMFTYFAATLISILSIR
jgi:hypothetical protein